MIPARFGYVAALSIDHAVELLSTYGPEARLLAGGQSLIPLMKLRLAAPSYLVDINRVDGLSFIKEDNGWLRIGAMTREADLEASDLIRRQYPAIFETARLVGDPLVRNLGTLGGNLAHADPSNDHPATMLALGARVVARGAGGDRTIRLAEFYNGMFSTVLGHDEILTEVQVPTRARGSGATYLKVERKIGDLATIGVAAWLALEGDVCTAAGIGLTSAGPTPIKARGAEAFLRGQRIDDASVRRAGELAAEESDPESDLRGDADSKRELIRIMTGRALRQAAVRAREGS